MSSTSAFIDTVLEFLQDLHETFPEEKQISVLISKTELGKKANPRLIVENCMNKLAPMANKIVAKDESIFQENSELIPGLNMHSMWNSGLSENTKNAIWDYANTLLMLGTTILSLPGNMLQQIEQMANSCVQQMETDDMKPDEMILQAQKALMSGGGANMLNNMMKNMNN
tara:strand:- start:25011 stop:25520 length:510 start_codon:yes stop_codon:yes gene_type:complete